VVLFFGTAGVHACFLTGDEYPHRRFAAHRLSTIHQLELQSGRHLAIVQYAPDHDPLEDWVYNQADIDGSRIVWARDMGAAGNRALIEYYKDRRVWLVEPDAATTSPIPYR